MASDISLNIPGELRGMKIDNDTVVGYYIWVVARRPVPPKQPAQWATLDLAHQKHPGAQGYCG